MCAPKMPVSTWAPNARSASANAFTSGSATAPAAAAFHVGRLPLVVLAYNVNWLMTRIGAVTSAADLSLSRILSCQSFSASLCAFPTSSSWVTPTSASSPCPSGSIAPTTTPSTVTAADVTRCTRMRTATTLQRLEDALHGVDLLLLCLDDRARQVDRG